MSNTIVQTAVSVAVPPAPSMLQQTGAIISQGATTEENNSLTLLTQASDLTPILTAAQSITAITWSASVVTVTVSGGHGYPTSQTIPLTIAGVTPSGYNGTFQATITSTTQFTYPLVSNPGAESVLGVVTDADVAELTNAVNQFFTQGSGQSVYVLELGVGDAVHGIASLTTWLASNPYTVYAFLVPNEWDGQSTFNTLCNNNTSTTKQVYFLVNSTTGTYSGYSPSKSLITMVPPTGAAATEFQAADIFQIILNYQPSSSNLVTPLSNAFLYGVTPWSGIGIQSTLAALKAAFVNYAITGAEGGLPSNNILKWGTTMDGQPFNFWYAIDWWQINVALAVANAIINGSNNPAAPLYYNQAGINQLQAVAVATMASAISFGLAAGQVVQTSLTQAQFIANYNAGLYAGQVVVNAVPFSNYNKLNPSAYKLGQYNGLSIIAAPQLGFQQILINITATETVA